MKKLVLVLSLVGALAISSLAAFAGGYGDSNGNGNGMDPDTYLDVRTEQINVALAAGDITNDEAVALLAHINEVVATGSFGENDEDCVLGEVGSGIFRNENSGQNNGQGFGSGERLEDGNGTRSANQSKGSSAGQGGRSNGGQSLRLQDGTGSDDCLID